MQKNLVSLIFLVMVLSCKNNIKTIYLDEIDLSTVKMGWKTPQSRKNLVDGPLAVNGVKYERGVSTHADCEMNIVLDGNAKEFTCMVGVDDNVAKVQGGSVKFIIYADGTIVFNSGLMTSNMPAKKVKLDIRGVKNLLLTLNSNNDGITHDHGDWLDAKITYTGRKPYEINNYTEDKYILTPKPPVHPKINGAKVFGVRPGNPFLFYIPVTGERPIEYSVENLPAGLKLDKKSGIITGTIQKKGEYLIILKAKNSKGEASRTLKIVCGDKIALTPPMGWNSWNCFGLNVSEEKVKLAADAFVSSGLINHGWSYINIDDGWEGDMRSCKGFIEVNEKFTDMKKLGDYLHERGLKFGIYSSPGPRTCGGYLGSYRFEDNDAVSYANWGVDYLKYDWCSYGRVAGNKEIESLKAPYIRMRKSLDKVKRDIVFSLCQYGWGDVWKWGEEVGGNCWRTTGDIVDTWASLFSIGFTKQDTLARYAKPGHWNDPDMLVVGKVGWNESLRQTRLSPSEQYSHISLWALLSAPMLLGCDLTQLDEFTLNLLTNDEVIDINQDALGKQASPVFKNDSIQIWVKELEDGSNAIGIFNISEDRRVIMVDFRQLNFYPKLALRDVWKQKDLGLFSDKFNVEVRRHGVALLKATAVK